jgi:ATP-dependent RNA helicase SUPV3L1/SUV3
VAIDKEAMSIDEGLSEMPAQCARDFSNIQGLQIVGAHLGAAEDLASEDWREALKLELEARAARFRLAVDASIVLSDDGVIRWLGDPVARLAAGPDLLAPRALILADASLPDGARETVAARLELWLAATTRRLLGPLLALRSLENESEPVRQLAVKIADSLGVLEREPVRSRIKVLDQNSRAVLRRHGVRFGAYYVYVPQLLKPASRALALQLWSLRIPDVSGGESAKMLLSLASSGRTSLPVNPLISKDGYRVAGFRPCGERVVRVDIVERLSDMIRAAFVACSSSDASPTGPAFVVSGQMTSLTGCSGESFASILRSLGYESFEIERSRLASPETAVEASAAGASSADAAPVAAPLESGAASISVEAPDLGADTVPGPDGGAEESIIGEDPDFGADTVPGPAGGAEEAPPILGGNPEETVRANEPTEPVPALFAPETTKTEDGSASPVEAAVIAWRIARRQRPERAKRRHRRGGATVKASLRQHEGGGAEARADSSANHEEGERCPGGPRPDRREKGFPPTVKRERVDGIDDKRRKTSAKQNRPGAGAQSEARRAATVDPNSPFAKLLELRTVLEKQGKNR